MDFINEIIETLLMTCLLEKDRPVSGIVVGPSGGGKSQTLVRWKAPWIHHTNDLTSAGLSDLLTQDHADKLRCIILPDFNVPLSHKSAVVNLTVSNMLSLMSEGTCRIDDGRSQKALKHSPMSIISAATPEMYHSHYKKWRALGFLRRFLLIHYHYGIATRKEGNGLIRKGKITSLNLPERTFDRHKQGKKITVKLNEVQAKEIEILSAELAKNLGYNIVRDYKTHTVKWQLDEPALEFAPHLTLQAIAKGNALKEKRRHVTTADIDFLLRMLPYTSPANPAII